MHDLKDLIGLEPSHQLAIDIFKGEWSSTFPKSTAIDTGGFAATCEDERIIWAESAIGGFKERSVLELGPLEGGHSYLLENLGALRITSIEANPKAYLKCLIAKEALGMRKVEFLLGDFERYLRSTQLHFDVCIACGVLYHLTDPAETLRRIADCCSDLFLWTHYYDADLVGNRPGLSNRFAAQSDRVLDGETYRYHHYSYHNDRSNPAYCGGLGDESVWMSETSLRRALQTSGFRILAERKEDNPNGPAIWIAARKR